MSIQPPRDDEYMVAVYFASRVHARRFAKLLPHPPAFVGKVKTFCMD